MRNKEPIQKINIVVWHCVAYILLGNWIKKNTNASTTQANAVNKKSVYLLKVLLVTLIIERFIPFSM